MTGTAPGAELAPEEAALYRRARAGDGKARQQLALRHLPLVREIAGRFRRGGIDLEELVQSGTVGLLQALQGFDPDRGYRFSTYAVPFIVGEIRAFPPERAGAEGGSPPGGAGPPPGGGPGPPDPGLGPLAHLG